jgi:hypothetical protein
VDNLFEYLTGTVTISEPGYDVWLGEYGLTPFYENPNNSTWGPALCRLLYHESLHFWQFLSSEYIARLRDEDWMRFKHFKNTGKIIPRSENFMNYRIRVGNSPFSAYELIECWARFWDVHTRGPQNIIEDEKIVIPHDLVDLLETDGGGSGRIKGYTDLAYDFLMLHGEDCEHYAEPYRWALNEAFRNSRFVQCIFPIIIYYSFATPDPISFFIEAFKLAIPNRELNDLIRGLSRNVNLSWLITWKDIYNKVIFPMLLKNGRRKFTSGFDIIKQGALQDHPIFSEYYARIPEILGNIRWRLSELNNQNQQIQNEDDREKIYLLNLPLQDFSIIFALPGQPFYRALLGTHLSPPTVRFSNFTYHARRPILLRGNGVKADVITYQAYANDLDNRVQRFRNAEIAERYGLASNAFEK